LTTLRCACNSSAVMDEHEVIAAAQAALEDVGDWRARGLAIRAAIGRALERINQLREQLEAALKQMPQPEPAATFADAVADFSDALSGRHPALRRVREGSVSWHIMQYLVTKSEGASTDELLAVVGQARGRPISKPAMHAEIQRLRARELLVTKGKKGEQVHRVSGAA